METLREKITSKAVNDVVKNNPRIVENLDGFLDEAWKKKIDYETEMFPSYCQEAYEANFIAQKALEKAGNKGRFTDSYGWNKNRTMLAKYVVPLGLKMFMINLVYYDFWDDSNARERDSFMKQICRGGCAEEFKLLLAKVIKHYGSSTGKLIEKVSA